MGRAQRNPSACPGTATWVEPICFQQRTWSTHRHAQVRGLMGFAALYPSYDWVCGSVETKMPALSRRHRVASSGGTLDQQEKDRKRVVQGKRVSVGVNVVGRLVITKKKKK